MRLSPCYARAAVYARDCGICYCWMHYGLLDLVLPRVAADQIDGQEFALTALDGVGFGRRKRITSMWQMDHRHAVVEGGAGRGLGN